MKIRIDIVLTFLITAFVTFFITKAIYDIEIKKPESVLVQGKDSTEFKPGKDTVYIERIVAKGGIAEKLPIENINYSLHHKVISIKPSHSDSIFITADLFVRAYPPADSVVIEPINDFPIIKLVRIDTVFVRRVDTLKTVEIQIVKESEPFYADKYFYIAAIEAAIIIYKFLKKE